MKNKDEITTELKTLGAGIIAGIGAENVFHVPENYFGQFPGQMMDIIQHMNDETSFDMSVDKSGPFAVPSNYFDGLNHEIMLKIKAMDSIVHQGEYVWQDKEKSTPFAIPEDYFATFESRLLNRISNEEVGVQHEIESISPLLAGLKHEKTFTVPENYFNTEVFTQQVKEQEVKAKVVQHPAVKSITWARWAAAAAVMAIFTFGGFHYLVPSSEVSSEPSFEQSLAKIPDNKIQEWLSNNMDEADINNLGGSIANIKTITTSHTLNSFSEKEIQDYLETEVW
ncbi:MAG: hypothetical protein WC756_01825 [Taibaiella sp.]|jgi:hypothetical protein